MMAVIEVLRFVTGNATKLALAPLVPFTKPTVPPAVPAIASIRKAFTGLGVVNAEHGPQPSIAILATLVLVDGCQTLSDTSSEGI